MNAHAGNSRRMLTEPARRTVASCRTHAEAEAAVDRLSDAGFPVDRVAIVGRGLQFVEQVTGRVTATRVIAQSALTGAVIGALVGWFLGLFDWVEPLVSAVALALWGVLFGLILGAILGWLARAVDPRGRDFTSVVGMRADSYDLLVDDEVADDAAVRLGR